MESLLRNLSSYMILKNIEASSGAAKPKMRTDMIKQIEDFRKVCDKRDSKMMYSPLLEEVIEGEKTFVGALEKLGPKSFMIQNVHIFGRNPYERHGSAGLEEDAAYLDLKIAELYHDNRRDKQ